ncbi:MAG TPA: TIM barrel protein [Candidatus Thermoplasmatota archaeon]|nr:TIM barrel protein [Candidatus Thermoplasmatota archaeon]
MSSSKSGGAKGKKAAKAPKPKPKGMIYLGPAGVPLSCKGRTTLEGVQHVQELGLNAMEIQFVRGIRMDEEYALEVGELAKQLGVRLSVHAPYYTNICADDPKTIEKSMDKIAMSGYFADILKADTVVCHAGFYTTMGKEETYEKAVESATMLRDYFHDNKFSCRLGIEVMGKQQTFGELDQIVSLCQDVEGIIPVLDFSHIHARSNGGLKTKEDFEKVFDKVEPLGLDHLHAYFTGVKYSNFNELNHVPIKKGDLDFNPLVEVILDRALDITVISNSPIVEHDAMYMKIMLERVLERRAIGLPSVYKVPAVGGGRA